MLKNIYLRIATKLFFADWSCDLPFMVGIRGDMDDDAIDFVFCDDALKGAEFKKQYWTLLRKECNRRLKDELN